MLFLGKNKSNSSVNDNKQKTQPPFSTLDKNITFICNAFNDTNDFKMNSIIFQGKKGKVIYLETITDTEKIEQNVFIPLTKASEKDQLKDMIVNVDFEISMDLKDTINALLKGSCALLFEDEKRTYLFNVPQKNDRDVQEPENEKVIRGSHQGFIENLDSNINLIRQRIRNSQLMIKYYELGMESNKNVAIIYMNNLANPSIVTEIEKRIQSISLDTVFSPGYIEECIEDNPFSPFPQNLYTERPDRLESHLIEGRIAIMAEGVADAIIAPVTFFPFFNHQMIITIDFILELFFVCLDYSAFGERLFYPLYILQSLVSILRLSHSR